jgi:hypothetical protein
MVARRKKRRHLSGGLYGDNRTKQAAPATSAPAKDTHADTERNLSGAP